jgi:hypothetical protein
MRPVLVLAVAAILSPTVLSAHPASAPGTQSLTDVSAAKKKAKKATPKKKDEYLKTAPGIGPSGPASMY